MRELSPASEAVGTPTGGVKKGGEKGGEKGEGMKRLKITYARGGVGE